MFFFVSFVDLNLPESLFTNLKFDLLRTFMKIKDSCSLVIACNNYRLANR